jgi:hypothetical protein
MSMFACQGYIYILNKYKSFYEFKHMNAFYAPFNKSSIKSPLKFWKIASNIVNYHNVAFFFAKNHQKATLIQIFGNDSFCLKKHITRFCPFFIFWEESVGMSLSTYYIINGHVQNCHQLSWNLLLPHYKIEKQNIVIVMIDLKIVLLMIMLYAYLFILMFFFKFIPKWVIDFTL